MYVTNPNFKTLLLLKSCDCSNVYSVSMIIVLVIVVNETTRPFCILLVFSPSMLLGKIVYLLGYICYKMSAKMHQTAGAFQCKPRA